MPNRRPFGRSVGDSCKVMGTETVEVKSVTAKCRVVNRVKAHCGVGEEQAWRKDGGL